MGVLSLVFRFTLLTTNDIFAIASFGIGCNQAINLMELRYYNTTNDVKHL